MILRIAINGLGTVGQNLLKLFTLKRESIKRTHGVEFQIICVADSSGVALNSNGMDVDSILAVKAKAEKISSLKDYAANNAFVDALKSSDIDLLFEASPVNLSTGGVGLEVVECALENGISVVSANKAPLVLKYSHLKKLAQQHQAQIGYSACVCGGMPIINLGKRDLVAANINKISGVLNNTTNYILSEMTKGKSFDAALLEAQQRGIAESDSSLDIQGWDSANKLLIIANSLMGLELNLKDISVQGIADITTADVQRELAQGKVFKLIASADDSGLSVKPVAIDQDQFLARCMTSEKGIEIHTDIYGVVYQKILELEPMPTAAAMMRDAINMFANPST